MSLNCLKEDCFNINKKKYDGECRRKILRKLTEMKNAINVDNIDCTFSDKEITCDGISKQQMEMWKYLSKLSIYLYNDYEFFSHFIIKQNSFDNEVFKSEMERLGYTRKANAWFQKQEPEEEVIINNIFNYCFTRFISNSNKINSYKRLCKLCESELPKDAVICYICNTDVEEEDLTVGKIAQRNLQTFDKSIFKKCDGKSRKKIISKLREMRDVNDLDNIGCTFSEEEIIFDRISMSKVEEEMEMRKYLSKLSIYLYNDYEFFASFIIKQNSFDNEVFKSEMERLGYIRKVNAWFQKQEPEEEVIISNIFNYCFTRFISNSNKINSTRLSDGTSCMYCDGEMVDGKCTICDDSLFKTFETEKDDTFRKYKPTDTIDRKFDESLMNKNEKNQLKEINIEEKVSEDDCDPKSFLKLSEQSSHWICDNCTFINTDLNSLNCEICETNRISNNEINDSEYLENDEISYNRKNREVEIGKDNNKDEQNIPDTLRGDEERDKFKEVSCGWKCHKCSHVNKDLNSTKCFVCEESRILINKNESEGNTILRKEGSPDDSWICEGCKYVNNISNKICEACKSNKETFDERRDLELPEETWICGQCKTSNSFDKYKCSNCKKSADFFNKWVCERCRFFNDKRANNCGACENENPDITKCSQCKEKIILKDEKCIDCWQNNNLNQINPGKNVLKKEGCEVGIDDYGLPNDQNNLSKSLSTDVTRDERCLNFIYCKGKLTNSDHFWCEKCKENQWFCPNEDCGTINYLNKYCKKCNVQKDSDVSNCKKVTVLKDNKPAQMWMCGFCRKYSIWAYHRCSHCKKNRPRKMNRKGRRKKNNLRF